MKSFMSAAFTDHEPPRHRDTEKNVVARIDCVGSVSHSRTADSMLRLVIVVLMITGVLSANVASAQSRSAAPQKRTFSFRGFAGFGATAFSASDSFKAVLGSASGVIFGGGVEVVLPQSIFVNVRATRFSKSGERVFVSNGEVFNLGIDTTVTVTPLEI